MCIGYYMVLLLCIRKKIQKGKPLDQIADELEEVPETIRPLYEKIKQEMLQ